MKLKQAYEYNATVVRVLDGDTIVMDVDLGFFMYVRMSCRLFGINAIELHDAGGSQAKTHLSSLLPAGTEVVVKSVQPDKYAGRFDGVVMLGDTNINQTLVDQGYAAAWDGKGPHPVPVWPIP